MHFSAVSTFLFVLFFLSSLPTFISSNSIGDPYSFPPFQSPPAPGWEPQSQNQSSSVVGGEGPVSDPVDTLLVLAPERTYRKDPLDGFKRYTGGWNLKDRHYWASVGFTAAPLFVASAIWFLGFGFLLLLNFMCCCCSERLNHRYSRATHSISLILLILFTIATIFGCIVLYQGQKKFHRSTSGALDYIVSQADSTVDKLHQVSSYIGAAKQIGVDQVFVPQTVQADIDQIGQRIDTSASELASQTSESSGNIRNLLDSVRVALIIVAVVMLIISVLGLCSVLSILGQQVPIYILVIVGWLLVAGTFILSGTFLVLHNAAGDTCIAVDEWIEVPSANTAIDQILPCVDSETVQDTMMRSKEVTYQLVEVVNQVITNVSNLNFSPNFPTMYLNQSGPLVPILCNPFHSNFTHRSCSDGEVDLSNATQVWSSYVCQVSGTGICATTGRLTPTFYGQMSAAVNVSYGLNNYTPFLTELQDCTFAHQVFNDIYMNSCPGLTRYSKLIYVGLEVVSASVMLSVIMWAIYGREDRKEHLDGQDSGQVADRRPVPIKNVPRIEGGYPPRIEAANYPPRIEAANYPPPPWIEPHYPPPRIEAAPSYHPRMEVIEY